ncbi:SH3 domain-containing protein [Chitinilyticum litopenaei]|uniref:SH3 domain-containing protein n=1 Tax=Chitinilyticum litopenaei TaxID=1121276 RepID=UPI0003FC9BCE|nr:SH3 domain-containing protein [Chitinilyticum litopenaei]
MKHYLAASLVLAGLWATQARAESGSVIRDADLRQKPFADAAVLSKLAVGAQVEILAREGAWMNVRSNGQEGWLKMLQVRLGSGGGTNAGAAVGQGLKVVTTGSSGKTVSTGVKGLSEEELAHAQPNYGELDKLKAFGSSGTEASRLAGQARLAAAQVPEIAVKGAAASSSDGNGNSQNDLMNRRR